VSHAMRFTLLATFPLAIALLCSTFAACGGGNVHPVPDGGAGHDAGGGGHGGHGGSPPMHAPYGLDTRPVNTTCKAPQRPSSTPVSVRFDPVFQNLSFTMPMAIAQIPGDPSRFFVLQRTGTMVSFPAVNPTQTTTVLTVPKVVNPAIEGGLLGMAFHP